MRRNGTTTYNHVGMRSHGRELSTYAMYQQTPLRCPLGCHHFLQVFAQAFARADMFCCGGRYYHYTGDPHGYLTQYFERIQGRTQMLMQRRAQALQLKPSDPAYGMLRGDGNEDLGSTEIGCGTAHPDGDMGDCQTELPCKFYARFAAVLCPPCPTWGLD